VPAVAPDVSARRQSLDTLVRTWHVHSEVSASASLLEHLPRYVPELGWQAILTVLGRAQTDEQVGELSRCLKTLIVEHGARFIEPIEDEASRTPRFKACLARVSSDPAAPIPAQLWDRLTRAADASIGPVSPRLEGLFESMPDLGTALYWDPAPLDPANPPNLTQHDLERLAGDWITQTDTYWAWDEVHSIVSDEGPDRAWEVVYRLFQHASTDKALRSVAAGPLENLLSDWGEAVIERVEQAALADPRFRQCLAGVWRTEDMSGSLWSRIVRARGC
jgi:hypothetical protein